MRVSELFGFNGASFRAPREARFSARGDSNNEPTKGMIPLSESTIDPRITEVILESQPDHPKKKRIIGTYAEWIVDNTIRPTDTSDEVVNILRAVVSKDEPLPLDEVASLTGTEIDRVKDLVTGMPFVAMGEADIDMPEVQEYFAAWKGEAREKLPADIEPESIDQLLTPAPVVVEVFNASEASGK